jgi:hypothetical protein
LLFDKVRLSQLFFCFRKLLQEDILYMNNKKHYLFFLISFSTLCFGLCLTSLAHATNVIYPGDSRWTFDNKGSSGTAVISAENPRGYDSVEGNASLALTTSGSPFDWAFYTSYAGGGNSWNQSSSYGLLNQINDISFDWFKVEMPVTNESYLDDYWGAPWRAQTPVIRLLIQDGGVYSELIWEQWYDNQSSAVTGTWVSENLIGQSFWRHVISADTYTIYNGTNKESYAHEEQLMKDSLGDWADNESLLYSYSSDAVVYGLSVGVGSGWCDVYKAYVDNIFLSFQEGQDGPIVTAIDDNFELPKPVPEPATMLLLGSGVGVLFTGRRWRGKKREFKIIKQK